MNDADTNRENTWACPLCGCKEREPMRIILNPYGKKMNFAMRIDLEENVSSCKNCKLVFSMPAEERKSL